jgi:hypothetical protein
MFLTVFDTDIKFIYIGRVEVGTDRKGLTVGGIDGNLGTN